MDDTEIVPSMLKCFVYPGPNHLFLSVGIFHVVELAERFHVTVLLEEFQDNAIPQRVLQALKTKNVTIIFFKRSRLLDKHRSFKTFAKNIPFDSFEFFLTDNDIGELNVYLAREAQRNRCPVFCYQTGACLGDIKEEFLNLIKIHGGRWAHKRGMPEWIGRLHYYSQRLMRHYWNYWLAPMLVGELPFRGKSSMFLRTGWWCKRDGDRVFVYEDAVKDYCLRDGLSKTRINLIAPPSSLDISQEFFDECYSPQGLIEKSILLLVDWPNKSLGAEVNVGAKLVEQTSIIAHYLQRVLPDVPLLIKPHPSLMNEVSFLGDLKTLLNDITNAQIVDPQRNAIELISSSRMVIGEQSTLLGLAQNLGRVPVISVGFVGSIDNRAFAEVYGTHCFKSVVDLLKIDISTLPYHHLERNQNLDSLGEVVKNMILTPSTDR
ncbi:MAG: hypothetical protein GKS01_11990 [Alphaproteobacteria bacterium]|nr:hypothetical protein [Alphaproteobacteria bacterium]